MWTPGEISMIRTLHGAVAIAILAAGLSAQTPDIHYVPTQDAVVDAMLDAAQVTAADVVYDLGSGDGRIVIEAARKYGARSIGVELDAALNKQARSRAAKAGVADKTT